MNKILAFQIFISELLKKYDEYGVEIKLDRYLIFNLLFITVSENKSLDKTFNDFYKLGKGPVDPVCFNWIYELGSSFEERLFIRNRKNIINNVDTFIKKNKSYEGIRLQIKDALNNIDIKNFSMTLDDSIDEVHKRL